MSSTIFNSTTLSANSLTVQRLWPSGGFEQAIAVIFAFCAPVNFTGPPYLGRSLIAASKPSFTYLRRTSRIVLRAVPKASMI